MGSDVINEIQVLRNAATSIRRLSERAFGCVPHEQRMLAGAVDSIADKAEEQIANAITYSRTHYNEGDYETDPWYR